MNFASVYLSTNTQLRIEPSDKKYPENIYTRSSHVSHGKRRYKHPLNLMQFGAENFPYALNWQSCCFIRTIKNRFSFSLSFLAVNLLISFSSISLFNTTTLNFITLFLLHTVLKITHNSIFTLKNPFFQKPNQVFFS